MLKSNEMSLKQFETHGSICFQYSDLASAQAWLKNNAPDATIIHHTRPVSYVPGGNAHYVVTTERAERWVGDGSMRYSPTVDCSQWDNVE